MISLKTIYMNTYHVTRQLYVKNIVALNGMTIYGSLNVPYAFTNIITIIKDRTL